MFLSMWFGMRTVYCKAASVVLCHAFLFVLLSIEVAAVLHIGPQPRANREYLHHLVRASNNYRSVLGVNDVPRSLEATASFADLSSLIKSRGLVSGHHCEPGGSPISPDYIVCRYQNLLFWAGRLMYLQPDKEKLPPKGQDWMFTAVGKTGLMVLESLEHLKAPNSAPAVQIPLVALTSTGGRVGFWNIFGQQAPFLHHVACKHYGRCSHNPKKGPVLLVVDPESLKMDDIGQLPWPSDWTACLGQEDPLLVNGPQLAGKFALIEDAFVLLNPECGAGLDCLPWDFRYNLDAAAMVTWRQLLSSCLGFDGNKTASVNPLNILLVDRDYWIGRQILNANEVVKELKVRYPMAEISVLYPEKLSLADQAAAYNNASVVLWVTGGSMADLVFAPMRAVAVHCGMREFPKAPYEWTAAWLGALPNSLQLHHLVTRNPDRVILRAYMVYKNDDYQSLTDDQKLAIWEEKRCPGVDGERINILCEDVWIGKGGELELDSIFLQETLDKFMPHLVEQYEKASGI